MARILPVRRKVKQMDWIMAWVIRTRNCAFCGLSLSVDYDKRDPGKSVTLHHTEGSRETDDWDNLEYVLKMVPAHSSCHKRYHVMERHLAKGSKVNTKAFDLMQKNVALALEANKSGLFSPAA